MSLAVAHNNLLFIRQRRSDIEYRLLMVTNQLTRLAYEASAIEEEKQVRISDLTNSYNADESDDSLYEYITVNISPDFDTRISQLNAIEKVYQQEKMQLETQSKEYSTLEESITKAVDSNIKNSFSYFKN